MRRALFLALSLAGCPGPVPPQLSAIEDRIFAPNCTFSSCHSTIAAAAHLSLAQGQSFANLVNQPCDSDAGTQDGYLRVVPGDLEHSFLILKLRDPLDPRYGDRMPQHQAPLDGSDVGAIEEWIRRGAQND